MVLESELEYQDDDGALILKSKDANVPGRLLDFYDTLTDACLKYSPDKNLGVVVHIRAYSRTGVRRR